MNKVFRVELSGGNGCYCELELPAAPYELLDALERLQMPMDGKPDWDILEYNDFPYLHIHLTDECDLFQLNALADRLARLDERQKAAFEGLFQVEVSKKYGPIQISTIIDLAYSTDCCHVLSEVQNDSQLGRFYAENGFMPELDAIPDSVFQMLDFEMLGRKARMDEGGVFTSHGYVTQDSDLEQVYDTLDLRLRRPDYAVLMELTNGEHNVSLPLPASHLMIDNKLKSIGAEAWQNIRFRCLDCAAPALKDLVDEAVSITHVNRLAQHLARLGPEELTKYKAILIAEDPSDINEASRLAGQLDEYMVEPDVRTMPEVAENELRIILGDEAAELLLPLVTLWRYLCVDLKSFYASVECVERGLDPMTTNLVVADESRTEKTICLAVSPSLKAHGISGRARLFEVVQRVKEVNAQRRRNAPSGQFTGSSWNDPELKNHPEMELDYIVAPPRMAHYIEWSTRIYSVYLKYLAPEDIFPYSIDEVFMDVTNYLDTYHLTARELARKIILDVLETTGITATAGMGSNLYLAKIAMDIVSKHIHPDKDGVRIAKLDEMTYRRLLWDHRPLTDFWRVGPGYARKLEANGLYTMGDIARCSIGKETDYYNEELLYKLFGVNAEILVDHAWGWEPCTIADVKAYKPENKSIVSGQVLQCPYQFEKAKLVMREMADALALDLVDKGLVTNQLVLTVGYDRENLDDPQRSKSYKGPVTTDRYGRKVPKHATGTINLDRYSSSTNEIIRAVLELFDRIVDKNLLVRRLSISANRLICEADAPKEPAAEQLDLFTDYAAQEERRKKEDAALVRERKVQEAMLGIKKKFGKNAILKGMNLEEGATARERNKTIGGHHE